MPFADTRTLVSFLEAARNRIWLGRTLCTAQRWLKSAAVALLLTAIIHLTVQSVSWQLVAGPIVALAVVFVLRAYAGRPTLGQSAALADKALGGRSLLTTAMECMDRGTASAAARIVVAQATNAADRMRERLSELQTGSGRPDFLWPVVVVFISVLILSGPGRFVPERNSGDLAAGPTEAGRPASLENESVDSAANELRQVLNRAEQTTETGAGDRSDDSEQGEIRRVDPTQVAAQAGTPQVVESLADPVSGGPGVGDEAGQGRGAGIETATAPSRQLAGRTAIEIQRAGMRSAGVGDSESALIAAVGATVAGPLVLQAASPLPYSVALSAMSPAEAAFARRYLAAMDYSEPGTDDE